MQEALEKALHSMDFVCADLRDSLHNANNVEGIVVMDMIKRASELKRDVKNLLDAHNGDAQCED